MIGIYKITNKLNGKVYIGQSIDIDTRWRQHINAKDNVLIHKSIQKYGAENFSFELLLECPADMLDVWERDMIALYDCISPKGYNLTEGGGGCKCSEETRLKMSNARKGIHLSEETRLKMSNIRKGIHLSEETKIKIGNAQKGIPRSEETKIKISNALKGVKRKPYSEETKHKMSESHKGHPGYNKGVAMSEETKIKMSNAHKGKHFSEETKYKISEAHKGLRKGKHWKIENGKRIWY